jgi:hypothetical protein
MIRQIVALCSLTALLLSGCAAQSAGGSTAAPAAAYLKVNANAKNPWDIIIYYRRESDEMPAPLSAQGLRRSRQAEITFDQQGDMDSIIQAISQTKKLRRATLQLNARWAIVLQNSSGQDTQAFYIDPNGGVETGSSEYVTDGTLLAFLRKKLRCVTRIVGEVGPF